MELHTTEICDITVRATMADDGSVRVTLHGHMTYGNNARGVGMTMTVEDADDLDAVENVLSRLREKYAATCAQQTRMACHEAELIAARRGESLQAPSDDHPHRSRTASRE